MCDISVYFMQNGAYDFIYKHEYVYTNCIYINVCVCHIMQSYMPSRKQYIDNYINKFSSVVHNVLA